MKNKDAKNLKLIFLKTMVDRTQALKRRIGTFYIHSLSFNTLGCQKSENMSKFYHHMRGIRKVLSRHLNSTFLKTRIQWRLDGLFLSKIDSVCMCSACSKMSSIYILAKILSKLFCKKTKDFWGPYLRSWLTN